MSLKFANTKINIPTGNTNTNIYTFELWFNLQPDTSGLKRPIVAVASDISTVLYSVRYNPTTSKVEANFGTFIADLIIPVIDVWYHLTLVKTTQSVTFYINGAAKATVLTNTNVVGYVNVGSNNLLVYNIEFIDTVKYTEEFIPSVDLPLNTSDYWAIIYAKRNVIAGAQVAEEILKLGQLSSFFVIPNDITISADMPAEAAAKSTICFVAGTPVLTDNFGYVPINELDADVHTIGGKKILVVTRTVTPERHLILIKEGTLAPGVPSVDTVTTHNHKIKINTGEMIKSYEIPGAQLIDYHGQSLYNVALKDGENEMIVNNMTVETLDPENLITKVHVMLKDATLDQRKEILNALAVYTQHLLDIGMIF